MEKVDFAKLKVGDLVEVPRTQFSQTRRGWNGWLFSHAVVIDKYISKKTGKPVVKVEMMLPGITTNDYTTKVKPFYADDVFKSNGVRNAMVRLDGVHSQEEYEKHIVEDEVTGSDWIKFLIDKGFLF